MPRGVYPHLHVKPKTYPPELVERVRSLYGSGMAQAEVAAEVGVSQKVIWTLMRNHGIPRRPQVNRDQAGDRNHMWKGSDARYQALHVRVEKARGKPRRCSACDTTDAGRYEWANLTGRYDDIADYVRLCIPCHRRLDAYRRRITGRPTSPKGGDAACPRT